MAPHRAPPVLHGCSTRLLRPFRRWHRRGLARPSRSCSGGRAPWRGRIAREPSPSSGRPRRRDGRPVLEAHGRGQRAGAARPRSGQEGRRRNDASTVQLPDRDPGREGGEAPTPPPFSRRVPSANPRSVLYKRRTDEADVVTKKKKTARMSPRDASRTRIPKCAFGRAAVDALWRGREGPGIGATAHRTVGGERGGDRRDSGAARSRDCCKHLVPLAKKFSVMLPLRVAPPSASRSPRLVSCASRRPPGLGSYASRHPPRVAPGRGHAAFPSAAAVTGRLPFPPAGCPRSKSSGKYLWRAAWRARPRGAAACTGRRSWR